MQVSGRCPVPSMLPTLWTCTALSLRPQTLQLADMALRYSGDRKGRGCVCGPLWRVPGDPALRAGTLPVAQLVPTSQWQQPVVEGWGHMATVTTPDGSADCFSIMGLLFWPGGFEQRRKAPVAIKGAIDAASRIRWVAPNFKNTKWTLIEAKLAKYP